MKKNFIFILFFLTAYLQAQINTHKHSKNSSCSDEIIPSLYNWTLIENQFSNRLNTTPQQTKNFFRYAAKWNYLKTDQYYSLVKEGSITQANAQQYWVDKLPYFEEVYKYKYLPSLEKEKENAAKVPSLSNRTMGSCNNLDFSSGNLNSWTGQWNDQGTSGTINTGGTLQGYGNLTVNGLNTGPNNSQSFVHEVFTGGTDPNVPINTVAPGHSYSLRLGNDSAYREIQQGASNAILPFNHQIISNTFLVTQANKIITYWYAVVLCQYNPNNHSSTNQPYFKIRMYDGNNNEIVCARYDVNALTASSIGGFNTIETQVPDNNGGTTPYDFIYKDWSPVLIPLVNYVGQNVTITFESSDCGGGGHPGYAYVVTDCAPFPGITFTPFACGSGASTVLTAPAGVASYSWAGPGVVGAASNQTVTVNTGGTYTVNMTTIGNSGVSCPFKIDTALQGPLPLPVAHFTNNTVCQGNSTTFANQSTGGPFIKQIWNFGDGSMDSIHATPTHTYTSVGTYTVSLYLNNGCIDTYTTTVTVNPSPTSVFSTMPVCLGAPTIFNNNSNGGITYHWNFGNNAGSSIVQNPTYSYPAAGNFVATLSVTNTFSCTAVSSNTVIVNQYPTVNFSAPQACLGTATVFNNTSTPTTGVSYNWNFGDGSTAADTSSVKNPSYLYPSTGTFSVTLTITPLSGCVSSKTTTLNVNPIPYITVTSPPPYCWNNIITSPTITNTPSTTNITYGWVNNNTLIGLNASGTGIPPVFTAALNNSPNDITGVITITPHLNGCTGPPESYTIIVKPTPIVTHASLNYCPGDAVPAIILTASPAAATSNITWSTTTTPFIGLTATNGSTGIPSFTAISNVTHEVSNVIVLNDNLNGCVGPTSTFSISVNANPTAIFSYANACDGNPTNFTDLSVANSGNISQWNWNFDTGTTTAQNPTYLLTPAGIYTVNLQVTSNKGCKHDTTETIVVNPSPVIGFGSLTSGCSPFTTTFIDTVSAVPPVTTWNWSFGNTAIATYSTNVFTSLTYTNASHTQSTYYTVSLSVVSDKNCVTTLTKNNYIQVYPKPLAAFTYDPKNADLVEPTITFSDQSLGASGTNAYHWNFGDMYEKVDSLDTASVANPKHLYSDQIASQYTVTQIVTNTFGCKDSIKEVLNIHDAVTFYIPNAFSPNGDIKNEGFKGTGIGIDEKTYNLWIFDRWGLLIFHGTNLESAWDGHYHGGLVQEDVYVWKVSFEDVFARPHAYHGTVTLIR